MLPSIPTKQKVARKEHKPTSPPSKKETRSKEDRENKEQKEKQAFGPSPKAHLRLRRIDL
jgi:hypothetical protein